MRSIVLFPECRKHTKKQATNLGLRGWCMNTQQGTVQGIIQGEERAIQEMYVTYLNESSQ